MKFNKGSNQNDLKYPITSEQIENMEECNLISVRVGLHHNVTMPAALCNSDAIKESLKEVLQVREMVKKNKFPRQFMEKYYPEEWGEFPDEIPQLLANEGLSFDNPEGLADVVHMDTPLDLGQAMIRWLISEGAGPTDTDTRMFDFVEIVGQSLAGMSAEVADALETAFEIKYYYGVPRPEEVAGNNMTYYPEGCPNHPSFPAGHGAAAFASAKYFMDEWNLSEKTKKALFDAAYIWAMARTLAGVHYAVDNLTFACRKANH